jgi:hypothetical protein
VRSSPGARVCRRVGLDGPGDRFDGRRGQGGAADGRSARRRRAACRYSRRLQLSRAAAVGARRHHLQRDHIDPVANGGETSYANNQPLCPPDHRIKTERDRKAGLLDRKKNDEDPSRIRPARAATDRDRVCFEKVNDAADLPAGTPKVRDFPVDL